MPAEPIGEPDAGSGSCSTPYLFNGEVLQEMSCREGGYEASKCSDMQGRSNELCIPLQITKRSLAEYTSEHHASEYIS